MTQRRSELLTKFITGALFTSLFFALNVTGNGGTLYNEKCALCHDQPTDPKVPDRRTMAQYFQSRVLDALTQGAMAPFVQGLSEAEIQEVAEFISTRQPDPGEEDQLLRCDDDEPISTESLIPHWGIDLQNTRFQSESAIDSSNVGSLQLKWVFDVPESRTMRGYPAVSNDTIFLPNTTGKLYAISRDNGCVKWFFDAEAQIRTAAHLFDLNGDPVISVGLSSKEIVVVRAIDGTLVHRENVAIFQQSMLTGSQRAYGGDLYIPLSAVDVALAMNPMYPCCVSHGGVHAMSLADWSIRWTARTTEPAKPTYKNELGVQMQGPSGAPIWTTPAIDAKRNQLYIGTGENTSSPATHTSDAIIAYDLASGVEKWVFQGTENDAWNMACGRRRGANCPKEDGVDFDFGASPILTTTSEGIDLVLAGQKSGDVWALNPDNGELVWHRKLSPGSPLGGVHWGMTVIADVVIVPIADPEFIEGANPGVFALDTKNGDLLWSHEAERGCEFSGMRRAFSMTEWPSCPWHYAFSAAPTAANDIAFAGSLDGRVFAFNVVDGEVLWSYDTKQEFEGINGTAAHGGSIDNPGIAVAGNQVMVLSGYDMFGQMPGNVLVMFELPSISE
ncbi:MAG: PQQ-binding-like beta-propeller repeat protein [Gammaproteobacteria bacterium]|nr:PQQ-binding-like beta-propeller repeat protein [Gammaproteobacteria bacterium]